MMNAERWQKVDKLLQSVLEREPGERAAYLEAACDGDDGLRQEVESLLASSEQDGSFLSAPAIEDAAALLAGTQNNSLLGRRLGVYQILSQLGAGGMGDVYLAQHPRLGRKVALKILPSFFTKDEQRLRRFQQEARAASALNHPNIVTIFDIGQMDSTHFIATEYIAGETLRSAMARKRMGLRNILDVAIQAASALAAAHATGIVHRDIKPENVMLRPDGYVKVLDFGLAKLTQKLPTSGDTEAPTIAKLDTDPGTVIGTVNYMSPEQARGQSVDARTDIFSLGVVLYEMIAGCMPFDGETVSHVIVSILEKEPPPLARQAPETPGELQRIVMKALRKDREERYQVIKDLLNDLRDLKQELETQNRLERSLPPESKNEMAGATNPERVADTASDAKKASAEAIARTTSSAEIILSEIKRHKTGAALALAALIMVIAAIAFGLYKFFEPRRTLAPFEIGKTTRLTTTGRVRSATISPDGKYVVYANEDQPSHFALWVKHVATGSNVQIVPPADAEYNGTTFSPDGNYIYYVRFEEQYRQGVLNQIPVLGGTPKKILTHIRTPITFSPDGKRFAFVRDYPADGETAIIVANADGSNEQKLASRRGFDFFCYSESGPAWSPDGEVIACGAGSSMGELYVSIFEVRLKDGQMKRVTPQRWIEMGRICWLRDGTGLIALAPDWDSGTFYHLWQVSYPNGETRRLTNDLGGYGTFSLGLTTDSNTLVTVRQNLILNIWTLPVGDMSRVKQVTKGVSGDDGRGGISWTPDGRIVYTSMVSGKENIWIMDADGKNQKQLTEEGYNSEPVVTADGRYIVYTSIPESTPHIWRMNIDGSNKRQLTDREDYYPSYSPDGRWVFYTRFTADKQAIWKVPFDGGEAVQVTDYLSSRPVVSPDGKQMVIIYFDEQLKRRLYGIIPIEGGKPVKTFDLLNVTRAVVWTPDGRSLLYASDRNGVPNIWSQPIDGGATKQLTDFKGDRIYWFSLSRDGKQLAICHGPATADVILISNSK
jgi:serine/threonine protein kinase/Tol biopolymer transport system component